MAFLNFRKLNTDCPKVFTTGMPRTYSTASEDMVSRAFWYCFIDSCMPLPIIPAINTKAMPTGTRHKSPSRQSNTKSSTIRPSGVNTMPALSGQIWTR